MHTREKKKKRRNEKGKLKQKQQENLLRKVTDQRNNFDVTSAAAAFAWRCRCVFSGGRVGLMSSGLYAAPHRHRSARPDRLRSAGSRAPGMLHPLQRWQLPQPRHLRDTPNIRISPGIPTSPSRPASQHPSAGGFSCTVPASVPARRPPGSPTAPQSGAERAINPTVVFLLKPHGFGEVPHRMNPPEK